MKIIIDAMGGDHAPDEIVKGAVEASQEIDSKLILVGIETEVQKELAKYTYDKDKIEICHASEVIGMNESPAKALRQKKDSSIVVGSKMLKEGIGDAFVSAGSTGAVMASSLLKTGRIKGIKRPAIATVFPTLEEETLLLDMGANVDSKPEHLVQHALMGQIYAKNLLDKQNPTVGLLSIGEEEKKGNELTIETHKLLKEMDNINFVGNVEGRDIFTGEYDVILCEGFVGNVVLKTTEGLASALFKIIKREITATFLGKIGGLLLKPAFKRVAKKMDYTEYGGAPLLGIDGITIISHGSSNAKAIKNAIKNAEKGIKADLINLIKANIES
ncbi:phosphate:acyl-[acyl carrier protein] acyltransferase [Orenia metallireducens]|uniref:Phosphate acyltransferase n=1 Tax=Orenia metallireducens TaxID=1413210 RepID=A0A285HFM4_9FIRM|nr:phosphate acyltransferase PlsX [Orenia metallireducens]PRX27452.1 phosphate:acyl-[acyl carrier protein] acyltransferase [Orenia metallireducens]SNY34530.1 phosphate:acyl-[acyl carrier protein] acyltransferase [Orenia metallireducens]